MVMCINANDKTMEKTLLWALVRPEFERIDLGPEHVQLTLFIYL